ncbi:hypothetical protein swp_3033 [Shewanella piezotolerans WP3]|uniref:Uncharacterized protein n=1 Tax=Shewanella piezotolerans (strain WP3 / JCM 13877) TaxID=225849 RepID=B8CR79_SHEPW|nr:hypothetical protein swp_3033 [Shewanella piezotolerans WP3]
MFLLKYLAVVDLVIKSFLQARHTNTAKAIKTSS